MVHLFNLLLVNVNIGWYSSLTFWSPTQVGCTTSGVLGPIIDLIKKKKVSINELWWITYHVNVFWSTQLSYYDLSMIKCNREKNANNPLNIFPNTRGWGCWTPLKDQWLSRWKYWLTARPRWFPGQLYPTSCNYYVIHCIRSHWRHHRWF